MTDKKKLEIKTLLKENFGVITPKEIMETYIFGPETTNEHYNIDEIVAIENALKQDIADVKADIASKVAGTLLITPEETDEEGLVTKEAVYFKVTTKTALLKSLSSKEWDVAVILDEVMDGKTWDNFIK